jgi:hypothetical protein
MKIFFFIVKLMYNANFFLWFLSTTQSNLAQNLKTSSIDLHQL